MTETKPTHSYMHGTEYSGDKMRAIITRSDGLTARSSWWRIDDGSAEAEASDLMQWLEAKES